MNQETLAHRASKKISLSTIVGLGTALPAYSISQDDACEYAQKIGIAGRYTKALSKLYRQSGVGRRYSVLLEKNDGPVLDRQSYYPRLPEGCSPAEKLALIPTTGQRMAAYREFAPGLALAACQQAVAEAQISVTEVTHLITVSCSGFCAPGVDIQLIQALSLNDDVQRTHVGFMGCHGSLNGLRVARAICESQPDACVLMVSVELCSLHQQYTDNAQQLVAQSLFADGAAAIVVKSQPANFEGRKMNNSVSNIDRAAGISIVSTASVMLPETQELMSWQIGDQGFQMGLSPQVPDVIQAKLPDWISSWLGNCELSIEDVKNWIVHPGGPRILTATAEALELKESALAPSWETLRDYGNMSSPTVFFVLENILKRNEAGPTVMLAFGPGLCVEACLLDLPAKSVQG